MNADAQTSPPTDPPPQAIIGTAPLAAGTVPSTPPVPVAWPDWFRTFDTALALLAVVLAFLMASFTARNSDLWRHLAAGRLVVQGQYPFGADPFSFTAEGRVWVNANWLGEAVLYLLFAADTSGAVAVAVKAVAFAAAFALLFLLRKPGQPLWPWAVLAAVGAVAAGGFSDLRPQVFGLPLLAGVLAVLYTADWAKGGTWRVPAMLGGLTAVWANVDSFAFLSPLLVGLVLLGEWLHPKVFPARSDLPPADDPFRPAPPLPALARGLLLCGVGCLLNPTFLAGQGNNPTEALAQLLPFELDWKAADDLKADSDLSRFTRSALNADYMKNPLVGGKNPAGVLALALWGLGVAAAAVGYRHGRLSHLLVWLAFSLLGAVVHARFVPYGVLVGVPFVAAHLNGVGRRVHLGKVSASAGRGLLLASSLGRVASLLAVGAGLFATLPGWLHPRSSLVGGQRSLGWAVEPDAGMKRAGELFARWRTDDKRGPVLAGTRGLNTHPYLGDYFAYFAPAEKSFVTSRYRLHRTELKDLVDLRRLVIDGKRPDDDGLIRPGDLKPLADKYAAGYLSVAQPFAPLPVRSVLYARVGLGGDAAAVQQFTQALWHVDGRLGVIGRQDSTAAARRTETMGWEAAAFAFGPQAADPSPRPQAMEDIRRPMEGWEYDLVGRQGIQPVEVEDALSFNEYSALESDQFNFAQQVNETWLARPLPLAGGLGFVNAALEMNGRRFGPTPRPLQRADREFALPFLAVRAARRGLTVDPNSAPGLIALASAFQNPLLPDTEPPREMFPVTTPDAPTERDLQTITALNRALTRLPPADAPIERYTPMGLKARVDLILAYLRAGRIGYIDSAHRVAADLVVLSGKVADADLVQVAEPLVGLWDRAFVLCQQDFSQELEARRQANQLPPPWLKMIRDGQMFELLVAQNYLRAEDDPRKWREKLVESIRTGKADAEVVRQKLSRLADVFEELLIRRSGRVERFVQAQPRVAYLRAVQSGLPERAIKIALGDDGKANPQVDATSAEIIRLMIWAGLSEREKAAERVDLEQKGLLTSGLSGRSLAVEQAKFRLLEYELAKLAGAFGKAETIYTELLQNPLTDPPSGRPIEGVMFADLWRPGEFQPLTEAETATLKGLSELQLPPPNTAVIVMAGGVWAWAAEERERLIRRMLFAPYTHYQRGVYALLAGDTKRAKELFDAANSVQGTPLDQVVLPPPLVPPLGQFLPTYRGLLEKYEKK